VFHQQARERRARRRHALLNSAALGLFAASWLVGRKRRGPAIPLVMQGLASAAMSVAGYLGGTLVYRNQIAVDHRYANAGRWIEATQTGADASALARNGEGLELNQMKLVRAGDERIVVGRTETGLAAFSDRCTHKGGPLSDGALICGTVQCPWHGSQFDVNTGRVRCGPAKEDIPVYSIG
jgi:nitrite reductase/ring-hydroxylating ferredoxin subunit